MGYNSIRMKVTATGTQVSDFRMAGKYISFVLVGDTPKTTGYERTDDITINFTDGTMLAVDDIVIANFEV